MLLFLFLIKYFWKFLKVEVNYYFIILSIKRSRNKCHSSFCGICKAIFDIFNIFFLYIYIQTTTKVFVFLSSAAFFWYYIVVFVGIVYQSKVNHSFRIWYDGMGYIYNIMRALLIIIMIRPLNNLFSDLCCFILCCLFGTFQIERDRELVDLTADVSPPPPEPFSFTKQ